MYWGAVVFGILGIAAVAGAVRAHRRIQEPRDRWSTIVTLSGFALASWFIGYASVHVFVSARESAHSMRCMNNMRTLELGLELYAQDWDNRLPQAQRWATDIDSGKYLPKRSSASVFHCPAAAGRYGYAFNAALGSAPIDGSVDLSVTVLLFETDLRNRNAAGSRRDIAKKRHGILNVGFADGHVRWMNLFAMNRWSWDAGPATSGHTSAQPATATGTGKKGARSKGR